MPTMTLERWQARLTDIASFHYDVRPLLPQLRNLLAQDIAANFANASTPDHVPWAPLKVPDHPPLYVTGKMWESAINMAHAAQIENGVLTLDLGWLTDYADYQRLGTRTIPAREFVGFSPEFVAQAEALIEADLVKQWEALWG